MHHKQTAPVVFLTAVMALALSVSGCTDGDEAAEIAAIEQALEDLDGQEIYCSQTATGSPHGVYLFAAKFGYSFEFTAANQGLTYLSIRDNNTGETLFSRLSWGKITATLAPKEHTQYQIFVWGRSYSLSVNCNPIHTPHCVMYETTTKEGTRLNNYYSLNVASYEEGKKHLAEVQYFTNEEIAEGTCAKVAAGRVCPKLWEPVCSDTPKQDTTWGNLCELKRHITEMAGDDDNWKGHWEEGPCPEKSHCVEWETKGQNFYAVNVGSYEAGKDVLAKQVDPFNAAINPGTCASQGRICPMYYAPICTDVPQQNTEHGNLCSFKVAVREIAGTSGEYKGHWEQGKCPKMCGGIAGIPCEDGYKCILDGDYADAGGVCEKIECKYDGAEYAAGETFPASDGCNTCTCLEGGNVACTEKACLCEPDKEWWRDYISLDPEQCRVIFFVCPEHTTYFSNPCGCGCEQSSDCPEWINCMPPRDCSKERALCPYSHIAW